MFTVLEQWEKHHGMCRCLNILCPLNGTDLPEISMATDPDQPSNPIPGSSTWLLGFWRKYFPQSRGSCTCAWGRAGFTVPLVMLNMGVSPLQQP